MGKHKSRIANEFESSTTTKGGGLWRRIRYNAFLKNIMRGVVLFIYCVIVVVLINRNIISPPYPIGTLPITVLSLIIGFPLATRFGIARGVWDSVTVTFLQLIGTIKLFMINLSISSNRKIGKVTASQAHSMLRACYRILSAILLCAKFEARGEEVVVDMLDVLEESEKDELRAKNSLDAYTARLINMLRNVIDDSIGPHLSDSEAKAIGETIGSIADKIGAMKVPITRPLETVESDFFSIIYIVYVLLLPWYYYAEFLVGTLFWFGLTIMFFEGLMNLTNILLNPLVSKSVSGYFSFDPKEQTNSAIKVYETIVEENILRFDNSQQQKQQQQQYDASAVGVDSKKKTMTAAIGSIFYGTDAVKINMPQNLNNKSY